jgi:hypothetical protein
MESTTIEELKELNEDLIKNIKTFNEKNLEGIVKNLDGKKVTINLLAKS